MRPRSARLILLPVVVVLGAMALVLSEQAQDAPLPPNSVVWSHDLDESLKHAHRIQRDVLVNFTHLGACYYCELLEREVLSKPRFLRYASRKFVLVDLNRPTLEAISPELLARRDAWMHKYFVNGIPTILLLDGDGRPYGITHYKKGGPSQFIRFLQLCKRARDQRDRAFERAARLSGSDRANALHEALGALQPVLSDFMHEPALTSFYRGEIDEILALLPDADSPIRQIYVKLLGETEQVRVKNAIYARLDAIRESGGYDETIKHIDSILPGIEDVNLANQLRRSRLVYLEWADRNEEALEYIRKLLSRTDFSPEDHRDLDDRVIFNLRNLGRVDEAIVLMDRRIRESTRNRDRLRHAYSSKGRYLLRARPQLAADAFLDAARHADDSSEAWMDAMGLAAIAWTRAEMHERAAEIHRRLLKRRDLSPDFKPYVLIHLIESLRATGNHDEIRQLRMTAARAIDRAPPNLLDEETKQDLRDRLKKL